jgi:hypothetical protein
MGIDATLTVVPRNEMRKKQRSRDLPRFELGREWNELDGALEGIGPPASLALRGNQSESDMEDMDADFFSVPPALVKRISKALAAVSDDQLLEAIHQERKKTGWRLRKYEHKRWIAAIETLRDAYRTASEQDAYVQVLIG